MSRLTPNYRITHRHGWEANIHIPETTERRLGSRDTEARDQARRTVCTRFRAACRAKGASLLHTPVPNWINWKDISLTKLDESSHPRGNVVAVSPLATSQDGEKCDDCPLCERGDHHLCANECTIGLRLLGR